MTSGRARFDVLRRWGPPIIFLVVVYGVLYQRCWSGDGCEHTLKSGTFFDPSDAGHLLLRPVVYVWVSLARRFGVVTRAQEYNALHVLFAGFGITALTILFGMVRRRSGDVAAWATLAIIGLASNCVIQIVTLDEKPLAMIVFAVAMLATGRLFEQAETGQADPLAIRAASPAALAWTIAVFGHLQNAVFAAAFLVTLLTLPWRGAPLARRMIRVTAIGASMAVGAVALFLALAWGGLGVSGMHTFLHRLFVTRYAPPPPTSMLRLGLDTLEGWTKAFMVVDRFSPKIVLSLAAAVFVVLAAGVVWGAARARGALTGMVLGGVVGLMALTPAANEWPAQGDSYTQVTLGAFLLLAAAPRRLLLPLVVAVAAINVPKVAVRSNPRVTIQGHLRAAIRIERSRHAPWIILREFDGQGGEQFTLPLYYSMIEGFPYERATLDSLPPGTFLVDVPLIVLRDGSTRPARVDTVERQLERHGRSASRGLVHAPCILPSDWAEYGNYLVVGAATSRP